MPRILLVRHGQAAGTYTDEMDPGLSEFGQQQARTVADYLTGEMPLTLISSPLKRAKETAEPLRQKYDAKLGIEERVSEIPSPGLSLSERGGWLQGVMQGVWSEQIDDLLQWREALLDCLRSQPADCAIFSHYVAINVATGYAQGDDQVTVFSPDNTSVTELSNESGDLTLVKRGDQAATRVN
ncbi:MAG: histidine phosphatase family protein [Gammaproteobacteria bacterium]|jgi:broad specificity phosphatase PhoE|nr:histidine phosphatase family protein [Gammaproteobacteria bacterium]MBT4491960.1 histidine phosphatase family protein [Gammaproteobacteria bacterium]MBT7371923.1 histidine phosphatase family protein [Gammaproteobacteria bacterium]